MEPPPGSAASPGSCLRESPERIASTRGVGPPSPHSSGEIAGGQGGAVPMHGGSGSRPAHLRRWLVGIAIACIVFELLYLVAAHFLLKGDALARLINKKPEKMQITWTSARSWFPGVVTVEKLEIRGQTRRIQWYVAADDVHARISLLRLPSKRVHLSSAHTAGIDFRLRRRLDPPAKEGEEGAPPEIRGSQHFPEIPGFTNPPVPNPRISTPPRRSSRSRGPSTSAGSTSTDRFGSQSAACDSTARGSRPGP